MGGARFGARRLLGLQAFGLLALSVMMKVHDRTRQRKRERMIGASPEARRTFSLSGAGMLTRSGAGDGLG